MVATVLIVTSRTDVHCNTVFDYLDENGVPWFRLNSEDVVDNLTITILPANRAGILRSHTNNQLLALSDVGAVWFRKPEAFDVSKFDLNEIARSYVEAEFNEIANNIYALLSDRVWINNPLLTRIASRKMWQLHVASSVGLKVPKTIISNNSHDIFKFLSDMDGDLALKSLSALHAEIPINESNSYDYGLFTRRVTQSELQNAREFIHYMPTTIQEYIEKAFELRVTSIGGVHFACRIDTQSSEFSKEDSRVNISDLPHSEYQLPGDVACKLTKYMQVMGINFGCHDIIVDKNNDYVFLECNPNGQWMWIERLTGINISKAIADFLTRCIQIV